MLYLKILRWFFTALVLQIALSLGLAAVFSTLLRNDSSGWGDLVGVVVGISLGGWLGGSILLILAGRELKVSKWKMIIGAILVLPVNLGLIGFMTNLGINNNITQIFLLTLWAALYTTAKTIGFNDTVAKK